MGDVYSLSGPMLRNGEEVVPSERVADVLNLPGENDVQLIA